MSKEMTSEEASTSTYIPLTQGEFALIDAADYDELSQYKWHVIKGKYTNYAARSEKLEGGGSRIVHMHRQIMNPPSDMVVDHIDGNGLDNRRFMLRVVTQAENLRNNWKRRDYIQRNFHLHDSEESVIREFKGERTFPRHKVSPENDKYERIYLTGGDFALVDAQDYDKLSHIEWELNTLQGKKFASGNVLIDGKRRFLLMHYYLLGAGNDETVSHRNEDGLDNRRFNFEVELTPPT